MGEFIIDPNKEVETNKKGDLKFSPKQVVADQLTGGL